MREMLAMFFVVLNSSAIASPFTLECIGVSTEDVYTSNSTATQKIEEFRKALVIDLNAGKVCLVENYPQHCYAPAVSGEQIQYQSNFDTPAISLTVATTINLTSGDFLERQTIRASFNAGRGAGDTVRRGVCVRK